MSAPKTTNVVDFESYRRRLRPTDDELIEDYFEHMDEEDIAYLLEELGAMFELEGPANDEYPLGFDPSTAQTIITFSPEGNTVWGSDGDELYDEDPVV